MGNTRDLIKLFENKLFPDRIKQALSEDHPRRRLFDVSVFAFHSQLLEDFGEELLPSLPFFRRKRDQCDRLRQ